MQIFMYPFVVLSFVVLLVNNVWASIDKQYHSKTNKTLFACKISKSYFNDYEPAVFNTSNNLLHKYDTLPDEDLQVVIIRGRVVDQNCNALSNATIYAWQAGLDGKYPYLPMRTRINKQLINYKSQSSFLGSGTAISDNLGYFSFITAYPEKINLNYINLRVQNAKIHTLQTRFYITSSDPEQYVDIVVMKK